MSWKDDANHTRGEGDGAHHGGRGRPASETGRRWKNELKHAFALNENEKDTIEPTDEQQVPIDWLSRQVAKRHLTTPIVLTLDICQPLNYVASQTLHFLGPAVWALSSPTFYTNYRHFARFLEHRGSVAHLCRRIQEIEDEYVEKEHGADEQP